MPVLILGTTGLDESAMGLRYYLDEVANPTVAASLTTAEPAPGRYALSGAPAVLPGHWAWITGEVGGQYFSYTYPTPQAIPPEKVVIPVRVTGLDATSLGLGAYKNGVLQADPLTATEIGSPGDYAASGWPLDEPGDWLVEWSYGGFTATFSWSYAVPAAGSLTHPGEIAAVDARLEAALAAAQAVDSAFQLVKANRNRQRWTPSAGDKVLRGYTKRARAGRLASGEIFDRYTGMIVVQILIPAETGDTLAVDAFEAMLPSFNTNGDGLEFEEAPDLVWVGKSEGGTHALHDAFFPYYFDRYRTLTA